jgi:hypothetical protein
VASGTVARVKGVRGGRRGRLSGFWSNLLTFSKFDASSMTLGVEAESEMLY